MNPLIPTPLDGVLMVVSLVALFLALAAFISLIRSASPSGWPLLAWTLVVLLIPFIGPAAWFKVQHRKQSFKLKHHSDSA
jgi:hypothetical protein